MSNVSSQRAHEHTLSAAVCSPSICAGVIRYLGWWLISVGSVTHICAHPKVPAAPRTPRVSSSPVFGSLVRESGVVSFSRSGCLILEPTPVSSICGGTYQLGGIYRIPSGVTPFEYAAIRLPPSSGEITLKDWRSFVSHKDVASSTIGDVVLVVSY